MIWIELISNMKSENTFCYYLVSDVSNIIGISEIFRKKNFLMSEKEHYIIRDKEGKLLNGYNKRFSLFFTLEFWWETTQHKNWFSPIKAKHGIYPKQNFPKNMSSGLIVKIQWNNQLFRGWLTKSEMKFTF